MGACAARQVVQVAAGGMHSAALTARGEVFTTGVNDEGALGRCTGVPFLGHLPFKTIAQERRGSAHGEAVENVAQVWTDELEPINEGYLQPLCCRLCYMHATSSRHVHL